MSAEAPRGPRAWVRWARVAVAVALVGVLAWRAGIGQLEPGAIEWGYVLLGALLVPLSILVRAYNHALLLNRPERVLSLWDAFVLAVVGVGINLVVPTGAADLAKAHWGWRVHGNPEAMVISSVLDKLTSLTALAAIGILGALVADTPALAWVAVALLVVTLLPFVAPRLVPWHLLLRVLAPGAALDAEKIAAVGRPPLLLLLWVYAVSAGAWVVTYAVMWLCCRAVGALVTPAQVLAFAPLSSLARLVPVSVAGIGVGEVTMAALLGRVGVPQDLAALAVLLSMALLVLAPGAVGAIIIARGRVREA